MLAAAGGGSIVRFGGVRFIVVIMPYRSAQGVHHTGAWLRINPENLGGCGSQLL